MRLLLPLAAASLLTGASVHVVQNGFTAGSTGVPEGWRTWAPRAEIAPRTFIDRTHYRNRPGVLAISGKGNAGEFGGWEYDVAGIEAGAWYRFTAYYRCTGVPHESLQILPRVDWQTGPDKRAGNTDYPYKTTREGDWNKVTEDVPAPSNASKATLQLFLFNAPRGTVWWDDVSFEQIPPPAPRPVTIASLNLRPMNTGTPAESVRQFIAAIDRAIPDRPNARKVDLILLPEAITLIGTGKTGLDVAETIPGPTTVALGKLAMRRSSYVVAGIYEREGRLVYNTAVLIDRRGELAGKYRKVYLPSLEVEAGITPGSDYPVFRTDFGTVGIMTCYDVMYPDPAHALARKGAEIILLPIWGGDETLSKARAVENQVFLVASGYDHPTYVMDPDGNRIASAPHNGDAAIATVDLNRRWWDIQLGDMRDRRMKEERVDVQLPGRE